MTDMIYSEEDFYKFCYDNQIYNQVEIQLMYNLYNTLLYGSVEEMEKGYVEFYYNYRLLKTGGFN